MDYSFAQNTSIGPSVYIEHNTYSCFNEKADNTNRFGIQYNDL